MAVQLNVNVEGFEPASEMPPLLLSDFPAVEPRALLFDEGSLIRGHFHWPSPPPPNGWTLIWGAESRRVWLSLKFKESDPEHPAIPDGWVGEAAVLGDDIEGFPRVLSYRPTTVEPVIADGINLLVAGQRWVERSASAFYMLGKFIRGEEPVLYAGANAHRIMLTLASIPDQAKWGRLDPDRIGRGLYMQKLDELFQWTRTRTRLSVCAIADLQMMGYDNASWAQTFVREVIEVMRPYTHLTFDLGNEMWNGPNGWRREWFTSRPNLPFLCTRGSFKDAGKDDYGYGGDDPWDAYRVHTRRDGPENEWKLFGHAALGGPCFTYGKPIIIDEGVKFGEVYLEGKQYPDPRIARIYGQTMRALNGGAFHSDAGCFNNPLGPIAEQCRAEFFADEL